jgi:hypothetical protein
MKLHQMYSGSPIMVLVPENDMETMFLKQFMKQPIEAFEITSATKILDHQVDRGLIIKTTNKI